MRRRGWLCLLAFASASVFPTAGTTQTFEDAAARVGIDFVHVNGATGQLYFAEMMGAGAAVFDFDGDGDLDIYLVQGGSLEPTRPGAHADRLFRNELREEGTLRFTDVTATAGLDAAGYGMGVSTGDIDNDGDLDLYLCNFGPNQLWRNDGERGFTNITAEAGVDDPRWSVGASFVDLDANGWLDLYVVNYVDFSLSRHQPCHSPLGALDYCGPLAYRPVPDRLFRNRGDGTFEDMSGITGISQAAHPGMGVVSADLDGNGHLDLYIANDETENVLWLNDGGWRLREEALLAGVATSGDGTRESSMGVDAGDFDQDGDEDLFLTHVNGQTNTLYRNNGNALFSDYTSASGLGPPSWPLTGFGTLFADLDGDSWLDLLTVTGLVLLFDAPVPGSLAQAKQLFRNERGHFEARNPAGEALSRPFVGRGAAYGDLDDDGDVDIVVANNGGPAQVLLNLSQPSGAWAGLRLLHDDYPRDALGTRVAAVGPGGAILWRRVRTDGGYASAHDPRVLFGLGGAGAPDLELRLWPPGAAEPRVVRIPTGRYSTVKGGRLIADHASRDAGR